MEALISGFVVQLLAISGLGGLAVGLIVPVRPVAVGVSVFVGVLVSFALASTSGAPVPFVGWMLAPIIAILASLLGWWVRHSRRA
jgi:hypothetical protein